ncbi:hypothetical protein BDZ89DRAFT_1078748 [Hymenopellis radicata]|nr:hypothetical protein BDZ89DRAFT_1078748 [Hymenopellis radicata]
MSRCCRRLNQLACQAQNALLVATTQPVYRRPQPIVERTHKRDTGYSKPNVPNVAPTPSSSSSSASASYGFLQRRAARIEEEQYIAEQTPQSTHLRDLFGLRFSAELSRRILTHASHAAAAQGHNSGLSFIGRRVLESYFLLMISSSPALTPSDDLEALSSHALNTYLLGQHVGRSWELGRVLRWVPAVSSPTDIDLPAGEGRSIGLYKVQGDTVAAVLGGVFREFGASTAQRLFHTRIMPHVLSGLPDRFHGDVTAACNRMGGLQAPLARTKKPVKVPDTGLIVTLP